MVCERVSQNSVGFDLARQSSKALSLLQVRRKGELWPTWSVKHENMLKEFKMHEKLMWDVKRNPQAIWLRSQKRKQRRTLLGEELFFSFVAYLRIS